ncbi:MAG: deoxyguanosinetriphosphate triphosphohydrolase [Lachnospiraceae bacterium]|nr:deoxyguanosinetriphosphate triphosphohydrolase [Lachnospiraceae bacterium]
MTIREELEQAEHERLASWASFSDGTRGRERPEKECDMRTAYQRDRDRILHSKAFRRLKQKTQVFLSPEGDHYRTRMTHTLEVSQIARTIARTLKLNEDLTEAIAYGHDLGHTPFGHAGERTLNRLCTGGFSHNEQSLRVVEVLEKKGQGLNLTFETRDGILNHKTSCSPATLEGKVVRLADKIAYINHDIDDAIRGRILSEQDIPAEYTDVLGHTTKSRLNTMIRNIVSHSMGKCDVFAADDVLEAMRGIRRFMFEHVYVGSAAKTEESKAEKMIQELFCFYMENISILPEEYRSMIAEGQQQEVVVCDYIAGMTDTYAIATFRNIFEPKSWGL